jgi:hypothetical protein
MSRRSREIACARQSRIECRSCDEIKTTLKAPFGKMQIDTGRQQAELRWSKQHSSRRNPLVLRSLKCQVRFLNSASRSLINPHLSQVSDGPTSANPSASSWLDWHLRMV